MDYKKIAEELLTDIGGKTTYRRRALATRLRLVLRDESKVDQAGLDARDEVKGNFLNGWSIPDHPGFRNCK